MKNQDCSIEDIFVFLLVDPLPNCFLAAGLTIEAWQMNRDRYAGIRHLAAIAAKLVVPEIDVCQYLVRARRG